MNKTELGANNNKLITLKDVMAFSKVETFMAKANDFLGVIGFTEHGRRHGKVVSKTARSILKSLDDPKRALELVSIAGYLHDIGNVINRDHHAQTGAVFAGQILEEMGMPFDETAEIIGAIGNHHEEDGSPVSRITAALIIADKADVHRSRVRNTLQLRTDIHDRVNYAVTKSGVVVDNEERAITLVLDVDTQISAVMEYFEIFLSRMMISRKAANFLGMSFHLDINGNHLL